MHCISMARHSSWFTYNLTFKLLSCLNSLVCHKIHMRIGSANFRGFVPLSIEIVQRLISCGRVTYKKVVLCLGCLLRVVL
jgi:hypothetical protein